jgi:hypothetical protein
MGEPSIGQRGFRRLTLQAERRDSRQAADLALAYAADRGRAQRFTRHA